MDSSCDGQTDLNRRVSLLGLSVSVFLS